VRTAVLDNRGKWSERDSTIPVTADIRLDRSLGRRGNGGKGALVGFGVGMGLTLLAVIANAADDNPDDYVEVNPGAILLGGTIMFGGAGALIGYGIGSAHRRDVWAEVPLDLPPQGDPYGMTDGIMRLGLRIDF
jgi:hypothetical protein